MISDATSVLGLQQEIQRSEESRYDHRLHGVLLVAPPQMEFGSMVLCVVADGHNAAAGNGTGFPKPFREFPEGLSVESSGLATKHKLTIPQAHGGKIAHALPRRMMIHGGSLVSGGTHMQQREPCC